MKEDELLKGSSGEPAEKEGETYITDQEPELEPTDQRDQGGEGEAEPHGGDESQGKDSAEAAQEAVSPSLVAELKNKLEEAEKKAEEHYQRFLRTQADFENFRRRTRKEKEELQQYAAQAVIEQLLPVLDNFERALEAGRHTDDLGSLVKGVEMVFNQLQEVLKAQGLETIPSVGQPFDPYVHEAVMQVESDQYQSGYVVEELQKGYKLKEKVLRPAMVKVSQ